ncbi:hypothetical protein HDU89_001768 [Geranomyces variabilis]|nr:hypothetical protein HDU89_001768 [Geranomyces variabilis]
MPLAPEIQEMILVYLPPMKCFTLSVELRLNRTRNLCVPYLPGTAPDQAAARGQVDLLQVWKTYHSARFRWSESALDHASKNGHLRVLEEVWAAVAVHESCLALG